jgi:hypothetical protein
MYSEPANNYQPSDYPILTDSTFESEDNSERIFGEFNFPMTTSSTTVQRLSKIQLLKARQQISFTAEFNLKAFQLDIGDTVQITNTRLGFSNKTFEISNWSFAMGGGSDAPIPVVSCEFRETASAVYNFATSGYSTISSGKATNLPSANSVAAPTAVTLSDELVLYNDGTVITKLIINVTAPSNKFTEIFEVEVKQDTDANGVALNPADTFKLIGRGPRTKFEFLNVIDAATYSVRVRSVNIFGAKSSSVTATRQIVGATETPEDVTGFSVNNVGSSQLQLSWTPVSDIDINFYDIRYQNVTANATWNGSTNLAQVPRRAGNVLTINARTGSFLIKAVDKLGNSSTNPNIIYTNIAGLQSFKVISTFNE